MKSTQKLLFTISAAAFAVVGYSAEAQYFKGKTVNVIVGFSAGGGSDLAARSIANHFSKHIEGNPNVVVKNLPGAGSVKAANFIYEKAKGDGQTVFFGPSYPLSQLMKVKGMRVKYDQLTLITPARSPGGFVTYMRKDAIPGGYKTPKDILKAKRLRIAGVSPTSSVDRRLQLSFSALGVDIVHITGHRGLARAAQSVRRGEMQGSALALSAYNKTVVPNMVEPGIVVPLFYWAFEDENGQPVKNPLISGIPTFREFYEEVTGKKPSGPEWEAYRTVSNFADVATHNLWGPPNMNKEAAAALNKAFTATLKDPEYIKLAERVSSYAHQLVPHARVKALLASASSVDPQILETLKKYANPERKPRTKKKSK